MTGWKQKVTKAGAITMAAMLMLASPLTVKAWELNGESTEVNDIKTKEPSSLITTIQTNYHAQGVTGFVVLTPGPTIDSILDITQEQQNNDGRAIIYIKNTTCGELAEKAFQTEMDKIGGELLWYFDIQLFKYADGWNQPMNTLSSPIRMAIGIGESERSDNYDYAMIRLHDGVTTLLTDLDSDAYTLTFDSDKFSTYAMIRYPKGNKPAAAPETAAKQDTQTAGNSNTAAAKTPSSELDEVPKTGDLESRTLGTVFMAGGFALIMMSIAYHIRYGRKK